MYPTTNGPGTTKLSTNGNINKTKSTVGGILRWEDRKSPHEGFMSVVKHDAEKDPKQDPIIPDITTLHSQYEDTRKGALCWSKLE